MISVFTLSISLMLAQAPAPAPAPDAKQADTERTEDVEILRRLLNERMNQGKQFQLVFGPIQLNTGETFHLKNPHINKEKFYANYDIAPNSPAAHTFDGIYLRGHGVVYTLKMTGGPGTTALQRATHLTTTCQHCHSVPPVPPENLAPEGKADTRLTDWDRLRNE
ncbi:MAG: hypothetical protein ACRCZF_17880, partial [Gemmataceae bacterium]